VCIQRATVNALVDTKDAVGGFNRHGTLHGSREFLTEPAMLAGFLLVGAWVRELAWLSEFLPAVFVDDEPPEDANAGD
jgi:hypothetical protein